MPDEQEINCIIGACCCNHDCRPKMRRALASYLKRHLGPGPYAPQQVADFMLDKFDFAENGTLEAYRRSIVKFAKGHDYEDGQ